MGVAKVQISKEYLEQFLRADYGTKPNTTIETNAPNDLEILGIAPTSAYYPFSFWIYAKSKEFDDVPEGAEPPEVKPFVYTVKHG